MRVLKIIVAVVVVIVSCAALLLWRSDRPPQRPRNVSANALYLERGVVPFKISNSGEWLDCWFDEREQAARCKLTNMRGWLEFEDVFLPYSGQAPVLPADLVLDRRRTGGLWGGTYEKGTRYPIVYLTNGDILLPRTEYEKAKQIVSR